MISPYPRNAKELPSARERVGDWADAWRRTSDLLLLLDFDGTLAPIVNRPEAAVILPRTAAAVQGLVGLGARVAIVSGRGLADARERMGMPDLAYAGNHGMEIELLGRREVHPDAERARGSLQQVRDAIRQSVAPVPGALVEDKGLTLSIHYRQVDRSRVQVVRDAVSQAVDPETNLRWTEGKEVLEVRPRIDWDKGRAVEFLVRELEPAEGSPVIYLGDDRTDEDAFRALNGIPGGEGVIVTEDDALETLASSRVKTPEEVGVLLDLLWNSAR